MTIESTQSFDRLDSRIEGAERALKDVREDFKGLRDQLSAVHMSVLSVGKPQYAVISGFAGVVLVGAGMLWGLAINPIKEDLTRIYSENHELSIRVEASTKLLETKKLDREEYTTTKAEMLTGIRDLNTRLGRCK